MPKYIWVVFVAVFVLFGVTPSPARAALLGPVELGKLRAHLGENVGVTKIYTKRSGDTSADWHAGVDGKGRTFTLMEITGATVYNGSGTFAGRMIVGGYAPQSWASLGRWVQTPLPADRTAFLFNFTQNIFLDQATDVQDGKYQTYNNSLRGPTFGGGFDLTAGNGTSMSSGYVAPYAYGLNGIMAGSNLNILNSTGYWDISVGEVETYAIISAVPLPPSAILFGTALFGMGAAGFRRNRKTANGRGSRRATG